MKGQLSVFFQCSVELISASAFCKTLGLAACFPLSVY